jgi:predicted O-methyltransferase YrrM
MSISMDQNLRRILSEIYDEGQRNDAHEQEHGKKMLNLEPDTAQVLSIFIRSGQRKHLLEIGTSSGYSTIWLAWAARATGGHLISIDRDAGKQSLADTNLRRAGLCQMVDLICGDATKIVANIAGPFDFVFFDADRWSAPAQLAHLLPKLTSDVIILADNALSHPDQIADYLAAIEHLPRFDSLILPTGKGLSVAYREA